jgi:hypothetical protein
MIIITDWHAPIALTPVGSTAGGYDIRDVLDLDRPYVGWRATTANGAGIQIDLGSALTVYGAWIDAPNLSSIEVAYSTDATTWTATTYTAALDAYSGRRKLFVDYGSSGIQRRYWRVRGMTSTTDDGSGMLYIGAVGLARTRLETAYGSPTLGYTIDSARTIDGLRPRLTSRQAVTLELGGGALPASQLSIWQALGQARPNPVLVVPVTTPYLCRLVEPVRIQHRASTLIEVGRIVLREVR